MQIAARELAQRPQSDWPAMLEAVEPGQAIAIEAMARHYIETNGGNVLTEGAEIAAVLLEEVHAFMARFISYPNQAAHVAHTLWVAHTHVVNTAESTPRLAFLSPEPGSGKSRALEVTATLVPRPVEAVNATPAYLFRKVSDPEGQPTLLYDEIDTLFGPRAKDNEEIRGMLNAGHRRGAKAGRCIVKGKTVETEELPAYCAVALAGLGNLPDTILTRSIVIKMRRRAPTERIQAYRHRIHAPQGYAIRDRLAAWAAGATAWLQTHIPDMPPGITDRPADVWEALLAIADMAGGDWPERARVAAVTLVTDTLAESPSLGVRMLSDLRDVFGDRDAMSTADIITELMDIEDGPWADLKGKAITPRKLANLLRQYGIQRTTLRIGHVTAKGYSRESLHDAWIRYLPATNVSNVTAADAAATGSEGNSYISPLGITAIPQVTKVTTDTDCPSCGGEGCRWCI